MHMRNRLVVTASKALVKQAREFVLTKSVPQVGDAPIPYVASRCSVRKISMVAAQASFSKINRIASQVVAILKLVANNLLVGCGKANAIHGILRSR
jgi:hypothetical protein